MPTRRAARSGGHIRCAARRAARCSRPRGVSERATCETKAPANNCRVGARFKNRRRRLRAECRRRFRAIARRRRLRRPPVCRLVAQICFLTAAASFARANGNCGGGQSCQFPACCKLRRHLFCASARAVERGVAFCKDLALSSYTPMFVCASLSIRLDSTRHDSTRLDTTNAFCLLAQTIERLCARASAFTRRRALAFANSRRRSQQRASDESEDESEPPQRLRSIGERRTWRRAPSNISMATVCCRVGALQHTPTSISSQHVVERRHLKRWVRAKKLAKRRAKFLSRGALVVVKLRYFNCQLACLLLLALHLVSMRERRACRMLASQSACESLVYKRRIALLTPQPIKIAGLCSTRAQKLASLFRHLKSPFHTARRSPRMRVRVGVGAR